MLRVPIAVHQDDGDRADAGVVQGLEVLFSILQVERLQHRAMRIEALIDREYLERDPDKANTYRYLA